MIKLNKGNKPEVLATNEGGWTQEFLNAQAAGGKIPDSIRFRYRHKDIKNALRDEAHNKCVYCERKVASAETDHILPVESRPDLIVSWENLALSCKDCNMHKGAYHGPNEPLLNPFTDDPQEHLAFYGPMIISRLGDQLAYRTIEQIKLHRTELFERRKERIQSIQALLEQWQATQAGQTKEIIKRKIIQESEADREFSATTKDFLYQLMGWR